MSVEQGGRIGGAAGPVWWDDSNEWVFGVFEGGGAKGAFYGAALEAVRLRGMWFLSAAGSSAGALTAAMVAAGATPDQLATWTLEALDRLRVRRPRSIRLLFRASSGLRADPPRVVPSASLLFLVERILRTQVGRTDIDEFAIGWSFPWLFPLSWPGKLRTRVVWLVRALIRERHDRPTRPVTFAELFAATGIELFIVTVDGLKKRERVFHHRLTPTESVARAAVSSAAIPIYFPPGDLDAAEDDPDSQSILFDGGVWSNFPTWLYKDPSFLAHHPEVGRAYVSQQTGTRDQPYVLGFLLDETEPTGEKLTATGSTARRPRTASGRLGMKLALVPVWAFTSPVFLLGYFFFAFVLFLSVGCGALSADFLCGLHGAVGSAPVLAVVGLVACVGVFYQVFRGRTYTGRFIPRHYAEYEGFGSLLGIAFIVTAGYVASGGTEPATGGPDSVIGGLLVAGIVVAGVVTALAVLLVAVLAPAAYGIGSRVVGTLVSAGTARYWVGSAPEDLVVRIPVKGVGTLDFDGARSLLPSRKNAVTDAVSTQIGDQLAALHVARKRTLSSARPGSPPAR